MKVMGLEEAVTPDLQNQVSSRSRQCDIARAAGPVLLVAVVVSTSPVSVPYTPAAARSTAETTRSLAVSRPDFADFLPQGEREPAKALLKRALAGLNASGLDADDVLEQAAKNLQGWQQHKKIDHQIFYSSEDDSLLGS